jgi:hypothetical protein
MIERYVQGDALNATEELLLVPVPSSATEVTGGFARQVFDLLPEVEERFVAVGGLHLCQTIEIGPGNVGNEWPKPYTVVLAGMHRREMNGWSDTPHLLGGILATIHERRQGERLAVAGTPGTGFSGLLGQADEFEILGALNTTRVPVVVYRQDYVGDRAGVLHADPHLDEFASVEKPSTVFIAG